MKLPFRLPWGSTAGGKAVSEAKAAGGGLALVAVEGEARWSGRSYASLSREGFMKNPVAHRTVRLVAEAAAAIPWLAYRDGRELEDHPAAALVGRPNARMGGADFFEALYGHLLLAGNAYVEALAIGPRPAELHLLRPDRVAVVAGADGWPEAYDYRAGTARRRIPAGDPSGATTGGGGLLHLKLFHPLDDHLGFPPLAAAQVALDLHNAAARWNKALLDNSARPSGALVYQPKEGGNLSADQYQRLKVELDEGYSGPIRAGRPLLLEGGLDWKSMGLSPKVFTVNWQAPEAAHLLLKVQEIGEVSRAGAAFTAELRSFAHRLSQEQGRLYGRRCDADLGDGRCKVDLAAAGRRAGATVVAVEGRDRIVVAGLDGFADGHFRLGTLRFGTGVNHGLTVEIDGNAAVSEGTRLSLWLPLESLPAVGDAVTVTVGCDKAFSTCRDRFANAANFRGFPHMPGSDFAYSYVKGESTHDGSVLFE